MSDASTLQLNFATEIFAVDSLVVWFSSFFLSCCLKWFKIWFVSYPTNLMNFIFKKSDQKHFKFCCIP